MTPLHLAAGRGYTDLVPLLIDAGAKVTTRDRAGFAPLDEAALHGMTAAAALLLSKGAERDAPNLLTGATPLNEAATQGHAEVVRLLLDRGADPAIPDKQGATPLANAVHAGRAEVVGLLLDRDRTGLTREPQLLAEAVSGATPPPLARSPNAAQTSTSAPPMVPHRFTWPRSKATS